MKFRCERDVLVEALGTASRAVASRSGGLLVLSGVRLDVRGDVLHLAGSDLDLSIQVDVSVSGSGDGVGVLPARPYKPRDKAKVETGVGPVLEAGETARAVIAALRRLNTDVVVLDRGSYLRVLVPGRCRMTREAVERALGRPFRLPGDLERVMPSFKGRLVVGDDEVVWSFDRA